MIFARGCCFCFGDPSVVTIHVYVYNNYVFLPGNSLGGT